MELRDQRGHKDTRLDSDFAKNDAMKAFEGILGNNYDYYTEDDNVAKSIQYDLDTIKGKGEFEEALLEECGYNDLTFLGRVAFDQKLGSVKIREKYESTKYLWILHNRIHKLDGEKEKFESRRYELERDMTFLSDKIRVYKKKSVAVPPVVVQKLRTMDKTRMKCISKINTLTKEINNAKAMVTCSDNTTETYEMDTDMVKELTNSFYSRMLLKDDDPNVKKKVNATLMDILGKSQEDAHINRQITVDEGGINIMASRGAVTDYVEDDFLAKCLEGDGSTRESLM